MISILKTLFRLFSYSLVSIVFALLVLLIGAKSTNALVKGWAPPTEELSYDDAPRDNSSEIFTIPSEKNQTTDNDKTSDRIKTSEYPDLGSEQVFPFLPGLDSYS